jgi:hypothetical protein
MTRDHSGPARTRRATMIPDAAREVETTRVVWAGANRASLATCVLLWAGRCDCQGLALEGDGSPPDEAAVVSVSTRTSVIPFVSANV